MQLPIRIHIILAKVRLFWLRLSAVVRRRIGSNQPQESTLQQHNRLLSTAAERLGYRCEFLTDKILEISNGSSRCFVTSSNFSFESLTAYWICGDKRLSAELLAKNSLPVPECSLVSRRKYDEALEIFRSFPKPVVVKPLHGSSAEGVTVSIETEGDFRRAFVTAGSCCPDILVEQFVSGNHWRVTMLHGELLVAWQRIPAQVVGDGKRSIRQLVQAKNAEIETWDEFPTGKKILLGRTACRDLATQNLTARSILEPGQIAKVYLACNDGLGGRTINITEQVHPGYVDISRRAANVVGAKLAGVDLIADDITVAPSEGEFFINEVNTTPGLISPNYDIERHTSAVGCAEQLLRRTLGS